MTKSIPAGRKAFIIPALLCLLVAGVTPISQSRADSDPSWRVKNRLQGKTKAGQDEAEKSENVSGIACMPGPAFPRLCLVADDESQGAQIVILTDGLLIAGGFIPLIHDTYQGKPLELDAEGVAYADGFFYVIGSHGRARHEKDSDKEAKNDAKAVATRHVFRIALTPDDVDFETGEKKHDPAITESPALAMVMQNDPVLSPFYDQALDDNGITVEGVAVKDGKMFVAFRGPVLAGGNAVIMSAPLDTVFAGQSGPAELHRLALGNDSRDRPRGIRDITIEGDGFLLIAGPEQDPPKKVGIAPGDYTIYAWDGNAASKLLDLQPTGKTDKPEALLPLDRKGGRLRALLMFDGPKEGQPMPVEMNLP